MNNIWQFEIWLDKDFSPPPGMFHVARLLGECSAISLVLHLSHWARGPSLWDLYVYTLMFMFIYISVYVWMYMYVYIYTLKKSNTYTSIRVYFQKTCMCCICTWTCFFTIQNLAATFFSVKMITLSVAIPNTVGVQPNFGMLVHHLAISPTESINWPICHHAYQCDHHMIEMLDLNHFKQSSR